MSILASIVFAYVLFPDIKKIRKSHMVLNGKLFVLSFIVLVFLLWFSYSFSLLPKYVFLLFLSGLLSLILIFRWQVMGAEAFRNVNDKILFLTHLSSMFKIHGKLLSSLIETKKMIPLSDFAEVIVCVQNHEDIMPKVKSIWSHYLCVSLFRVMSQTEHHGNDRFLDQLRFIDEDLDTLSQNVHRFSRDIDAFKRRMVLLSLFGLGVSYGALNMLRMVVDISSEPLYQNISFIFLLGMILVLTLSFKVLILPLVMKEECLV